MTRTIELRAEIPANRRLVVQIPDDMPIGDARVVVEVALDKDSGGRVKPQDAVPDYSKLLKVPQADDADLWGWEWAEPGQDISPRIADRDG